MRSQNNKQKPLSKRGKKTSKNSKAKGGQSKTSKPHPKPPESGESHNQKAASKAGHSSQPSAQQDTSPKGLWLYGRHSVAAALRNPRRQFHDIHVTRQGGRWLVDQGLQSALFEQKANDIHPEALDALLPPGSVHQGVAALVAPLEAPSLEDLDTYAPGNGPIIILDQITDPQNIGAIYRVAAAFGARAIIVQDRRTPPLAGALAKAAAGTIELLPCIEVVNIARTITAIKEMNYFCIGLAGEGGAAISNHHQTDQVALVLGSEGSGLRPLVAKTCDTLASIPINAQVESLNVSTATAIALYALTQADEK